MEPSFADRTDFENAQRGLIASLSPCIITTKDGRPVYNNDKYAFLDAPCPDTANPKLWRHGQLTTIQGLFEVARGVYQVRGLDVSNMTVLEGATGIVVVDPLTSTECAAAALALYRTHRGPRPVTGLIYSHSHMDHFGGARGVLPDNFDSSSDPGSSSGSIPILAPEGFMEEALSENIYVGPAMRRRAIHMYGNLLPASPTGHIGCGIGTAVSTGTGSLVPPTDLITTTGEERIIDGITISFQLVPGTEAPSEMNFYLPGSRTLYIAECATHCLHNVLTLRGAQVRDAKAWARYLDEALVLYPGSEVLCAGHHWPIWERANIEHHVAGQRDLYGFLHDQTVRLMNTGMTGVEIAEVLELPPGLAREWHAQGFYGSLSHNVKAVYQRYMGWFDGSAVRLWEYPPLETARRYVKCLGGVDQVVTQAEGFVREQDWRFAATLLGHVVAVAPDHARARDLLAAVLERLGFGAENATWRNFYLSAAQDLRRSERGADKTGRASGAGLRSMLLSPDQQVEHWWALLSVSIDGPRAAIDEGFVVEVTVVDEHRWRLIVSNGVLTYRTVESQSQSHLQSEPGFAFSCTKSRLMDILRGNIDLRGLACRGDEGLLFKLISLTASA